MTLFDPRRTHRRQADSDMAEAFRKLGELRKEMHTAEGTAHEVLAALHRKWDEEDLAREAARRREPTPNRAVPWWRRVWARSPRTVKGEHHG